jgi:DNA-binding GntR family transcriptional regulator
MATFYLSATTAPASHQKIYAALRDGDRKRAQREMQDHILFVRDTLLRSLEPDAEMATNDVEEALLETSV